MGFIKHHSIIVTGDNEELLKAREKCLEIFKHELSDKTDNPENIVSPIVSGICNGQSSFFIAPDGSKEFWATSNECDTAREVFLKWLKEENNSEFIEVCFGGDSNQNYISKCSNND